MACKPCEARRRAARNLAAKDYERAEKLAESGRITQAALLKARAKAIRLGVAVAGMAGKALGIDNHGEVADGSGTDQGAEPNGGGNGSVG